MISVETFGAGLVDDEYTRARCSGELTVTNSELWGGRELDRLIRDMTEAKRVKGVMVKKMATKTRFFIK